MDNLKRTILLADNSTDYALSMRRLLELEGYRVEEAGSVEEALRKLASGSLDLALVDLLLTDDEDTHDISGLEVAKQATAQGIPCIIITAHETVETMRQALRARGMQPALAVDYIPKANGPQAALDAIRVILNYQSEPAVSPHELVVDLEQGLVHKAGRVVDLSPQQYALIAYLHCRDGAVCTYQELYEAVYHEDVPKGQASADKRLSRLAERLKEKIEDDPSNPRHLITVYGRGFRLVLKG